MAEETLKNGMMRMRELAKAAGVPKGTIQFYIKEGLIPRPIKKTANSAFYTDDHLNDILLIKELQSKRFLPLTIIKEVMRGGKGNLSVNEIRTLIELDGELFLDMKENPELKPITEKQILKQTGISLKDLRKMEKIGLLTPLLENGRKRYGEDDIRLAECRVKLIEAGLTPELGFTVDLAGTFSELIGRFVEEESRVLTQLLTGKLEVEEIATILKKVIPIVNTMLGIVHRKEIRNTTSRYAKNLPGGE